MSEPLKVSISPKAMSTEWCISPNGGQQKPAMSRTPPKTHSPTDNINCTFFMLVNIIAFPWLSVLVRGGYISLGRTYFCGYVLTTELHGTALNRGFWFLLALRAEI